MNTKQTNTTTKTIAIALAFSVALMSTQTALQAAEATSNDYQTQTESTWDPLESFNRGMSSFNEGLRAVVIDPVTDAYQAVTPDAMQKGFSNAASNLTEPVTVVSSALQGDMDNASTATKRFVINSTAGFGGLNDEATDMGYDQRQEDLGQAAAVHGVGPGPYVVLPVIGPSNLRDASGKALTMVANPMPVAGSVAQGAVQYSDAQDDIQALHKGALDTYSVDRDVYNQYRQDAIANGNVIPDGPSWDDMD